MIKRLSEVFRSDSGYQPFFLSVFTFALSYGLYKGVPTARMTRLRLRIRRNSSAAPVMP